MIHLGLKSCPLSAWQNDDWQVSPGTLRSSRPPASRWWETGGHYEDCGFFFTIVIHWRGELSTPTLSINNEDWDGHVFFCESVNPDFSFPFWQKIPVILTRPTTFKKIQSTGSKTPLFRFFKLFTLIKTGFGFPLSVQKVTYNITYFLLLSKYSFPNWVQCISSAMGQSLLKKKITWVLTVITGAENPSWKVDWQHLEKPLVDVKKGVLLEDFVGFKFLMGSFSSDWHLHTPHTSIYGDQKKKSTIPVMYKILEDRCHLQEEKK